MSKTKQNTLRITLCAMFIALYFVFDRFTAINLLTNQYKLSFIPVIISAVFFGPLYGAAVGGIGDLLSALIMPTGAYFPGFTIVSALIGLIFGLFCHKKMTAVRCTASVLVNQGICSLILNTFNVAFFFLINNISKYGNNIFVIFGALFASRAIQAGIYTVAEIAFMLLLLKIRPRIENRINSVK